MPDDWRPDWQNEDAYAHLESATNAELAWEFLRRSEQYAKDWREYPRNAVDWIDGMPILAADGGALDATIDDYDRLCRHYMVGSLVHPSESAGPDFTPVLQTQWEMFGGGSCHNDVTLNYPGEVIIKFDLNEDLVTQLRWAEQHLKLMLRADIKAEPAAQKRADLHKPRARYIRLLDGHHQGVKTYALRKELFPNSDNDKEANALLKSAQEYADGKYKLLVKDFEFVKPAKKPRTKQLKKTKVGATKTRQP